MVIKVFIEQTGELNKKNVFDEKTGKFLDTVIIPLSYPYPYGYILDTKASDGGSLDCYVISDRKLAISSIVECEPVGMVEWFEDGQADHKILARLMDEQREVDGAVQRKITDFAVQFIANRTDKQYQLGKFLDKNKAEELINASRVKSFNCANELQQDVIDEFSSELTKDMYLAQAEKGLWQSEEIVIDKYFPKNSSVLDIGCGTGRTTIPLHLKGYQVLGVDITPMMIESAKKIITAKKLDIHYQIGDATKLEFENNFFDNAIFANNGWTQIPGSTKRQKALDEIYRVLKPGGYFIFTAHQRYYSPYHIFFWLKQWLKLYLLKPLGFKVKELEFGDRFFQRNVNGKKTNQWQYIHIPNVSEVKKQIQNSGFKLVETVVMAKLSESDAANRRSTLTKKDQADKSPVFYICQK
ncbi:MAG: methyltransferase domain-containing protein [Patescibacteria group bacterium]|jgi:ubiquinone/menaquinone biosynthesis C-methylase UbiE/inorganic pyrophosphatase